MRKYVLLNRDPPYDSERLTKGLLGLPQILAATDLFKMRIVCLAGAGYRDPASREQAEARSSLIRSYCERYSKILRDHRVAEQIKDYCSNITAIANIKYQMGDFYFKTSAVPKYVPLISEMGVEDPETYVINTPELAKYTVNAYNIIVSEYYAGRAEYERLTELTDSGGKEPRIVWDHSGAGVTLPYAVSMLKTGTFIMANADGMDRIMALIKNNISKDSSYTLMPDHNFTDRILSRPFDIRSVYANYSTDEIEKEAALSPVKIGALPSDAEIAAALAGPNRRQATKGQI